MDRALTYRATLLAEWMGSESYQLVQEMLREAHARRMEFLLTGGRDRFDENVGYLAGLTEAIRLAEQTVLDEQRQRAQEVGRG